jgi:hypothetical protein
MFGAGADCGKALHFAFGLQIDSNAGLDGFGELGVGLARPGEANSLRAHA